MFTKILELKINCFYSDDWPNRGGERRSIESMMSRRFTWFPNWLVIGEPNNNINLFVLQEWWLWRVPDCEELVGVTHRRRFVFQGFSEC